MGVLPSTQPVATLGSSFIWASFDLACTCCVPYHTTAGTTVEVTARGVRLALALAFEPATIPYCVLPSRQLHTAYVWLL